MARFKIPHVLRGWLSTVAGLTFAAYLLGILFVFSQFGGNARFPGDCALVFGSAVRRGSAAGPGIERRIEAAARLWKEGKVRRLILTGGVGEGNALSEARVMQNEALRLGIAPEALRMEEGATSTWQNLAFAQPFLMECDTIVAVSDRYHLARIRLTALRQGIALTLSPADPPEDGVAELVAVFREAVGLLVYLVRVPS